MHRINDEKWASSRIVTVIVLVGSHVELTMFKRVLVGSHAGLTMCKFEF